MNERTETTLKAKGERLIPMDGPPRRGEYVLGELDTVHGPRLHVIHWRRQKRLEHQAQRDLSNVISPRRALELFMGRNVTNG